VIVRWAILVLLLAAGPAMAAPPRFAVVIGNNRPESSQEATLRYADDDAVATQRLLIEAGVHSVLLTTLDDETTRLAGTLRPDGKPTWAALLRSIDELYAAMRRAGDAELLFFYSGHGDVAHGEGYVMLEDRRLTRRMLYQLLARSPARRNHVIVDACKSYFLAFERGPGGRHADYAPAFDDAELPAGLKNTGFILSTSSDRESHEWERFQAGIFSHEVRSALRGAADVDGDGRISYAELGAFLMTANQGIANARLRPDFAIRPPDGAFSEVLFGWSAPATAILGAELGHVYAETATGERLLDGHAAAGQTFSVHLPAARPIFVRTSDETREYVLADPAQTVVASLVPSAPSTAPRGALHAAFEQLFAAAFGPVNLSAFGAQQAEAERLLAIDHSRERSRRLTRRVVGGTAIALLAAGTALSAAAIAQYATGRRDPQDERVRVNRVLGGIEPTAGVALGAGFGAGVAWLVATF
jgi:hypothetical protein